MTRVLVTGGCGFVGSNLVATLQRAGGFEIVVLDDESLGSRANLQDFSGTFLKGDIADRGLVRRALADVNVVVHLAAHTRVIESIETPEKTFHANVAGTFGLLEECRRAGIRRFVNASTGGAIVGDVVPPVTEEFPPRPLSPYGASKLATEGLCSAYTASYGMACVSLRFSNIYGPGSLHKGSVVAHFLKQVLALRPLIVYGDGTQQRDYLFIDDLVEGLVRVLKSDATGTFQLGSGKGTPLNELIAIIGRVTGRSLDVRYEAARTGEIHSTWNDIAKARAAFGFDPRTSLADGIARTWDWFRAQQADGRPLG